MSKPSKRVTIQSRIPIVVIKDRFADWDEAQLRGELNSYLRLLDQPGDANAVRVLEAIHMAGLIGAEIQRRSAGLPGNQERKLAMEVI